MLTGCAHNQLLNKVVIRISFQHEMPIALLQSLPVCWTIDRHPVFECDFSVISDGDIPGSNSFNIHQIMHQKHNDEDIDESLLKMLKQDPLPYKESHTFEERFIEYQIIRCNYPGFIPIYC